MALEPCLCEKRECVRLDLRFIRVAVEHSMMLNLAYRGFSKNRCMQVVDATSVFNGPFLSQSTTGFLKASALHCTASNPSFYFFCDFYVDFSKYFFPRLLLSRIYKLACVMYVHLLVILS